MNGKAKVFDLLLLKSHPYEEREKNVFYSTEAFKARIVELAPGARMPVCQMESHVAFVVLKGEAHVIVEDEEVLLDEGKCLITPPATISMSTMTGTRVLGIQILGSPDGQ